MASADVTSPSPALKNFEHINAVELRLKTAKVKALPERYVKTFPTSEVGSNNHGGSSISLPVIDLAGLTSGDPAARQQIVREVGNAASEFGFFQVVNHGVPEEAINALDNQVREFFALPVEVKERAENLTDIPQGYSGRLQYSPATTPWIEYLAQWYRPSPAVEVLADKIWPGGNPNFCNAVHRYCQSVERLGIQLMELLAESLGLKADFFSKHYKDPEGHRSAFRLHRVPACPDASRALGASAHSDSTALTILRQDEVGGLQVSKDGKFIDATPVPGGLVVNVGDTLEAWTNGRFPSADHRVLVDEECDRYSIVYFIHAGREWVIESPPELIDDAHPSLYRPFTFGEFRDNFERLARENKLTKANSMAFARR